MNRTYAHAILATTTALALCGCTTNVRLATLPEPTGADSAMLPAGIVYRLPEAEVSPSASLVLIQCPEGSADPEKNKLKFDVSGDLKSELVPGQRILVDYRTLSKFLKTGSFEYELHDNKMLKSLNSTTVDESPEFIAAVAATIANIVLLGAPSAAGGLGALTTLTEGGTKLKPLAVPILQKPSICNQRAKDTLKLLSVASDAHEKASANLALQNQKVTLFLASRSGKLTESEIKEAEALSEQISQLKAEIAAQTAKLKSIEAMLSLPLNDASDKTIAAMISSNGIVMSASPAGAARYRQKYFTDIPSPELETGLKTTVTVKGAPAGANYRAGRFGLQDASAADSYQGKAAPNRKVLAERAIIYVEPAVYEFSMTTIDPNTDSGKRLVKSATIVLPQKGHYLALPLVSGFGEKSSLSATFAADGSLLKAKFEHSSNGGRKLAESAKGISDTILATEKSLREQKAADLEYAIKMKELEAKLNPPEQKIDPNAELVSKAAGITAQVNVVQAEWNQIELQAKIAKACAETPKPAACASVGAN